MKCSESIFKDIVWKIEEFKLLTNDKRGSVYSENGFFEVLLGRDEKPCGLRYQPEGQSQFLDIPLFMNLGATYIEQDDIYIVVVIVGNDACELHRLILKFRRNKEGSLKFEFEAIPLFDDCTCEDDERSCGEEPVYLYSKSSHGLGNGTGGNH